MPSLNWRGFEIRKEISSHPARQSQLTLTLEPARFSELLSSLGEVFRPEGRELRVDLPDEWIIFWKRREGESRLLIAHPQAGEWVTTAALSESHGRNLIEKLGSLMPGGELRLGSLEPVAPLSNVEIVLKIET